MFQFTRPSDAKAHAYLNSRRRLPLSYNYRHVGATRGRLPEIYATARHRVLLGHGEVSYVAACQAMREWRMFPPDRIAIYPARPPIEAGTVVVLRIRALQLWSLAACRIVYTTDEASAVGEDPVVRFGFGYGTLPGHVERGEERFCIEWNRADDTVWYDLAAFSQADQLLVWIGLPVARYYQRRFAKESALAMQAAVGGHRSRAAVTVSRGRGGEP